MSEKTYIEDRQKKPAFIFRYKLRAKIVADAAKKYLATSMPFRILDLGSAEGLALLELRKLIPSGTYVGIEHSDELLACVPRLPSDTRIIKGDATNLPETIKGASYDIVCALALLEHLPDPLKAAQEAYSALQPGGIFIATCIAPFWDDAAKCLGAPHTEWHISQLNKKGMTDIVEKSGMKLLVYGRFMWAPIAFLPYIKIPVSPSVSMLLDRIIRSVKIFDKFFINQYVVARKPM